MIRNDRLESTSGQNVIVVVASKGRPDCVQPLLHALATQTCRPQKVIYSVTSEDDFPQQVDRRGLHVDVIVSSPGLARQRNCALMEIQAQAKVIIFLDDDFLPATDWIENCCTLFTCFTDLVGLTGTVIKDGAVTGPISWHEAECLLSNYKRTTRNEIKGVASTYGCNMAFRSSAIGDERFDERLVLYGWLEDNDFSRRISRRGRLVTSDTLLGVHLSIQRGRVSGKRLGYSQVVNPVYLARKGSLPWSEAITTILRPVCANLLKSLRPEAHIDRRGRLIGNMLGFGELLCLRSRPELAIKI